MRTTHPPTPTINRLPRLIVWATAMILWAAAVLLGERRINRRHIRQRYRALGLTKLTHLVRNLMIIRAAQLIRRRPSRPWRNFAPAGFRRRRGILRLRAIAGSRLRRLLNDGASPARVMRLIHIIRNLDAYVRRFLLHRGEHGMSRSTPIIAVRPPHETTRSLTQQTPLLADSS